MRLTNAIQDVIVWRGLNFLSLFILNVLVARYFEASQAGSLFFFINNLSLVILVLSFSLEAGLGFYGAGGNINTRQLGMLALAWCLCVTVIIVLLSVSLKKYISLDGMNAGLAAICFVTGNLLTSFFAALYYARQKFIAPNLCLLVINVILVALFAAGLKGWITEENLLNAYFAGFLVQGIGITLFYFLGNRDRSPGGSLRRVLKKLLKYSLAVFLSNVIFFLVYRIDYWFVDVYCKPGELGNYIQVAKIIQWLLLVPMMISSVLFPLTASGSDSQIAGKIALISRILLWIYLFGCLLAAATGYWAFVWLFGDTYTYMYPVFLLHIPGILALVALHPIASFNAGINRADINLKGSLLALLVIVILNFLFTPAFGIYAASIASSIGYLIYFGFCFYQFSRLNQVPLIRVYKPLKTDFDFLKSMLYRQK